MKLIIIQTDDADRALYQKLLRLAAAERATLEIVSPFDNTTLAFPGLEIRCEQRQALRNGKDVNLTRREYDLLYLLASRAGHAVSQKRILEAIS